MSNAYIFFTEFIGGINRNVDKLTPNSTTLILRINRQFCDFKGWLYKFNAISSLTHKRSGSQGNETSNSVSFYINKSMGNPHSFLLISNCA